MRWRFCSCYSWGTLHMIILYVAYHMQHMTRVPVRGITIFSFFYGFSIPDNLKKMENFGISIATRSNVGVVPPRPLKVKLIFEPGWELIIFIWMPSDSMNWTGFTHIIIIIDLYYFWCHIEILNIIPSWKNVPS